MQNQLFWRLLFPYAVSYCILLRSFLQSSLLFSLKATNGLMFTNSCFIFKNKDNFFFFRNVMFLFYLHLTMKPF